MPQINRIRVNNVKYNFGTQFYDDFVMRFSCKNTIYDLANGGGKSLLMLLLMQNLIPNCTLDDKQPIEKLFRKNSGNTTIHSLVEWKLDSCYVKEGFQYMTTGFCARRALGADDENSSSTSVEYYNYCIFYKQFGDNDIRNLPLSKDGERVTYNGLKQYLRDLEKNDFGVKVYIFDGKGEYQSFISKYGLYESEWEIVRGINKTEGHVRTYFETNYRTSRKVVEDLLIEEIIQKSFINRMGATDDEASMAQTLMDIKGQLVELAKKRGEMNNFDEQAKAFEMVLAQLNTFEDIYKEKQRVEKELAGMYAGVKNASVTKQAECAQMQERIEELERQLSEEIKAVSVALVMEEEAELAKVDGLCAETEQRVKLASADRDKKAEQLKFLEAANDYKDYCDASADAASTKEALDNCMRDHEDVLGELHAIAKVCYDAAKDAEALLISESREAAREAESKANEALQCDKEILELKLSVAAKEKQLEIVEEKLDKDKSKLNLMLSEDTVLVVDDCERVKMSLESEGKTKSNELSKIDTAIEATSKSLEDKNSQLIKAEALMYCYSEELTKLSRDNDKINSEEARLEGLSKVYGESDLERLVKRVFDTYMDIESDVAEQQRAVTATSAQLDACRDGRYIFDGEQYKRVKEYLLENYGDVVVEGGKWFNSLDLGRKRDINRRLPMVEYGFVIKGDFTKIKEDMRLLEFEGSSYIVPIISEQVLFNTRNEINSENIVFATRGLEFLYDENKRNARYKALSDELELAQAELARLTGKRDIIFDDYQYCMACQSIEKLAGSSQKERVRELQANIEKLQGQTRDAKEGIARDEELLTNSQIDRKQLENELARINQRVEMLSEIEQLSKDIDESYATEKELSRAIESERASIKELEARLLTLQSRRAEADKQNAGTKLMLDATRARMADFIRYYPNEEQPVDMAQMKRFEELPVDVLESRFKGLSEVFEKDTLDVTDKQALLASFENAKLKAKNAIEYKGMKLSEVKERFESREYVACPPETLMKLKEELSLQENEVKRIETELSSQCAMKNRLEGSVEHAKRQVIAQFGAYEPYACKDPKEFEEQHKKQRDALSKSKKELLGQNKRLDEELKDITIIEKDLARIVANAGIDTNNCEAVAFDKYEASAKAFNKITKQEIVKKEEFLKVRQRVVARLEELNVVDMATEVSRSLNAPSSSDEVRETRANIEEIIAFTQLEKERIEESIVSMEKIKESFENRCIQTCANIRAELDRLPKMSTITMDDQRISIVGLNIPYVKDSQIKERMSDYIDETVTGAESFKNPEDRLKFIRSHLAWKKLFSVIVTDMNSVKIELYKRERIKDQSRYLPYEEAVGSTGQSQGIYIQFLISLIHYISSVNAAEGQAGALGKTIFIDNPFGAAKDIYIWEPIFKLLKANHVQLIVPARGATPAITGRFDVNYILGQKLVGGRQQTVVVDYESQVQGEMTEYIKMDYSQATLDFLN